MIETPGTGCMFCGHGIGISAPETLAESEPERKRPGYNPWAISLQSIWIVATLLCISFAVMANFPGLGIILLIFSVPAVVRTMMLGNIWRAVGKPLSWYERVELLAGSVAVFVLVAVSGAAAFCVVCFSLGLSQFEYPGPGGYDVLYYVACGVGGLAALVVAAEIFRTLWYQPIHRWRTAGELPTVRRNVAAFFSAVGRAVTTLLGAMGGALQVFIYTINFSSPLSRDMRAILFALLAVGLFFGGHFGWYVPRRWPRFFAVAGVFAFFQLISLWILFLFAPTSSNIVALLLLNLLLPIGLPGLIAFGVWKLWPWNQAVEVDK